MISIICVYNNEEILNSYLLKSLKNQTLEYDLILIDNTKERFESAAKALNYGARKAKGDNIMFIHQDIDLYSNTWLKEVEKILTKLSNFGIAGVAGKKNKKGTITNLKHGKPPGEITNRLIGRIHTKKSIKVQNLDEGLIRIHNKKPIKVQTIDECLIIIPKSVFDILQFDEKTCDNWHLYAVDYCLSVKEKFNLDVYVIPMHLYHLSSGVFNLVYYKNLMKVFMKHKNNFRWIYMRMGDWNTLKSFIRRLYVLLTHSRAFGSREKYK